MLHKRSEILGAIAVVKLAPHSVTACDGVLNSETRVGFEPTKPLMSAVPCKGTSFDHLEPGLGQANNRLDFSVGIC